MKSKLERNTSKTQHKLKYRPVYDNNNNGSMHHSSGVVCTCMCSIHVGIIASSVKTSRGIHVTHLPLHLFSGSHLANLYVNFNTIALNES